MQRDLSPRDARDVEQVVDQPGHVARLAPDHLLGQPSHLRVILAQPQKLGGIEDRGQGIAQLMGEHGEELVLAAVALDQPTVEAGVVDRQTGAMPELLAETCSRPRRSGRAALRRGRARPEWRRG